MPARRRPKASRYVTERAARARDLLDGHAGPQGAAREVGEHGLRQTRGDGDPVLAIAPGARGRARSRLSARARHRCRATASPAADAPARPRNPRRFTSASPSHAPSPDDRARPRSRPRRRWPWDRGWAGRCGATCGLRPPSSSRRTPSASRYARLTAFFIGGSSKGTRGSWKNVKYTLPGFVVARHSLRDRNRGWPRRSFVPFALASPNSSPHGLGPVP